MLKSITILFLTIFLASCNNYGEPLNVALTDRMDAPNAKLDNNQALSIINHLRISNGSTPLKIDLALNQQAQILATKYANSDNQPKKPNDVKTMQISAGYANFANTFSGWRASPASANILTNPNLKTAGIGVAYSANSTHGVYWILLLNE